MARINVCEEAVEGYLCPKPYLVFFFESKVDELKLPPQKEPDVSPPARTKG